MEDKLINGHEAVDLGLPSGTFWATCNVGASSPEEFGDYFAWGETESKNVFSRENNKLTNFTSKRPEPTEIGLYYPKGYTCERREDGSEYINYIISGSKDYDAARAQWGASWRMPLPSEFEELVKNCTWEWTAVNSIEGYKITGPNGNSIFLPAAGEKLDSLNEFKPPWGCDVFGHGYGYYLSGQFHWFIGDSGFGSTWPLIFNPKRIDNIEYTYWVPYNGASVRPVAESKYIDL